MQWNTAPTAIRENRTCDGTLEIIVGAGEPLALIARPGGLRVYFAYFKNGLRRSNGIAQAENAKTTTTRGRLRKYQKRCLHLGPECENRGSVGS